MSAIIFAAIKAWCVKNWRILAPVVAVIAVFFLLRYLGGLWAEHQQAVFNRGWDAHKTLMLEEKIEADKQARSEKVKNEKNFKVMPITDIDRIGHVNGWVRAKQDR